MVIELRNYLLKPGAREDFIEYFKEHFIDSQETKGAHVPGIFHIKAEPDRFAWIRQFDSMEERSRFLPAFYGGDVWAEFGPAANDMMLEWHHVHLLKPYVESREFGVQSSESGVGSRACPERPSTPLRMSRRVGSSFFSKNKKVFVIDFYKTMSHQPGKLIEILNVGFDPGFNDHNNNSSFWISEMEENDFPRLPVYQDAKLLVQITGYDTEMEYESTMNPISSSPMEASRYLNELVKEHSRLVLYPAW